MLKKALITLVLVVIALASNGAGPASARSFENQDLRPIPSVPASADLSAYPGDGEEFREEFHQTYPLSGTGRIGLENINGGVQIKVWDRAAVQVDATKKAWRKDRLAEARIEVNATEDNLHIRTEYPDGNQNFRSGNDRYDNPATVEYSLTIPRKAVLDSIELVNGSLDIDGAEGPVKASSINGRVNATGLLGDVKLSTINGPLNATFTQLDEARPISLGSVNGSLTMIIPSDANASIRAGTVHGGIKNTFGMRVKHGQYVGHNLDGQIGTGGPRIKLSNVNGAININNLQDGKTLNPANSVGNDNENDDQSQGSQDTDIAQQVSQTVVNATAIATTEAARVNSARIARDAQREAQREVDEALRQAQREIAQAQREIQRANQRQIREQVRIATSGRGRGAGAGGSYADNRLTAQESKSFTVSGSPNVNVNTFDGSIGIHGWDKPEVMYTLTKRADDDEGLKQISMQASQNGSSVSLVALSENERNGTASLEIWVPRKSALHVSSDDGSLKLDGVSGDLTLRTGDGSIDVSDGGGQLQVNTGDGSITVLNFDGQVDARTGDGAIRLDGNLNAVSARTGDGAISLSVPPGSNFTLETNAEGDVTNQGLSLAEDISPSKRVKRWRVGNGGKVFVLSTGDGQIVLRSR